MTAAACIKDGFLPQSSPHEGDRREGAGCGDYFRSLLGEQKLLPMEELRMSGTTDKIKGRVKEAIGVLTNDDGLKTEGKLDQRTGKIKEAAAHVIDKVRDAARAPKSK
jgi:uncharacterized protein YjbJ (UPF0337 family)